MDKVAVIISNGTVFMSNDPLSRIPYWFAQKDAQFFGIL
jgi:hypothetical protein